MADLMRVVKGLEYCTTHVNCKSTRTECPYVEECARADEMPRTALMRDALDVLKDIAKMRDSERKDDITTATFAYKADGSIEQTGIEKYKFAVMAEAFGKLGWWGIYADLATAENVAEMVNGKVVLWK